MVTNPVNKGMSIRALCLMAGVKPADLSDVPDPRGRIDHLASMLLEHAACNLSPDLRATYHAARPLIDGLIAKHLGGIRVPEEAMQQLPKVIEAVQEMRKSA